MNTQQRSQALNKFIDYLDGGHTQSTQRIVDEISEVEVNQDNLPRLEAIEDLVQYHHSITGTIEQTYEQVRDIMRQMQALKHRKKNVQSIIDCLTAMMEVKRISYGLGVDPKEIYSNLEVYYSIRGKVHFVERFVEKIDKQIEELQKEYQTTFDSEMTKNNSNNIAQLSKVLQLIRTHSHQSAKPDSLQQIIDFCLTNAKKEFKSIEEELFGIPIVGYAQSNYQFFDMAKTAMKIIATLCHNCKTNVIKVAGEEGVAQIEESLFGMATNGVILELLMRLTRYYQIDKIVIKKNKFSLKEKELKKLQPYFKEFIAIWNQLERLRIHLLQQVSESYPKKVAMKLALENLISSAQMVDLTSNAITFMQAMMRFRFDKLLKRSPFVSSLCSLDSQFFREIGGAKGLAQNAHLQDFLQETMNGISDGIEKALETLNTLIISAIINFVNHNLIFEDVFYAFNELFSRCFVRFPTTDPRTHHAIVLALNSVAAFPRALRVLLQIPLPSEIPGDRIRTELEEVVNNNEEKAMRVQDELVGKIVDTEWFRQGLNRDYERIFDRWTGLQAECMTMLAQNVARVHAELILEGQFGKKYNQVSALALQKEVRAVISFYEDHAPAILPHFKTVLDFIDILLQLSEQDLRRLTSRWAGRYPESQIKRIWGLRL